MGKFKTIKKFRFKLKYLIFIIIIIGIYLLYTLVLKNIELKSNETLVKKILSNSNNHLVRDNKSILEDMLFNFVNNPVKMLEKNLGEINEKKDR